MPLEGAVLYLFIVVTPPPGERYAPQKVSRGPGGSVAMKGTYGGVAAAMGVGWDCSAGSAVSG